MTAGWFGGRLVVLGAALAISTPLTFGAAEAARMKGSSSARTAARAIVAGMSSARAAVAVPRRYAGVGSWSGGLQCVPFARENSGIELKGDAYTWWGSAAGIYERGARPEVGSLLNFRSAGRIPLGHLSVVADVIDSRTVKVDQANWAPGRITRDVTVVDLSPNNDWSMVRVGGGTGLYSTYGFIYDRPDTGTMVANTGVAPTRVAAAATAQPVEVAEAVDVPAPPAGGRWSARKATARAGAGAGIVRAGVHRVAKVQVSRRLRAR